MDEELHISVEDKGIGFDVEKWKNCPKKNEEHTNIGVINVEEIICLEYGQDYGLNIESALGRGTKVIYTLPRKMRNDTHDYCR